MKKLKQLGLVLAVSMLFMGCPYGTEIAIDEKPTVKVMPALVGKWEQRSSTDYSYLVSKTDEFNYKIEKTTVSSGEKTVYMGFVSDVAGDKFFNIYEEKANPKTYYLYRIDMSGGDNMCKLQSVTQNIDEKFTTSADLRKFITQYKGLSFFYEKDEDSYIKTGK
ncbi:MAG: hypothetical protein ACHQRM_02280 [Bacteroidia bacterium]